MGFDPMDRRNFLGIAGGALICTIAGKQYDLSNPKEVRKANAALPVPPKVAAAKNNPGVTKAAITGNRKEYWITAEPRNWNVVPKKRDEMMNVRIKRRRGFNTTVSAFAYRQWTSRR